MAWLAMLTFYAYPKWLVNRTQQHHNAIEFSMQNVKKSIALMVIIITVLSLIFSTFEFVQDNEKPGEIFAVLLVHGAISSLIVALLAWLGLKNRHQVGLLIGWFILVYWIPLWLWNMVFEIHVGFSVEHNTHLFLQLAHDESLLDWHMYFLGIIWVHATAVAVYGIRHLLNVNSRYLSFLVLLSSILYLCSFLLLHRTHKTVEVIYLIFGMG